MHMPGDVVELVDTLGLEPSAARRGGSTPSIPTIKIAIKPFKISFLAHTTEAKHERNRGNTNILKDVSD